MREFLVLLNIGCGLFVELGVLRSQEEYDTGDHNCGGRYKVQISACISLCQNIGGATYSERSTWKLSKCNPCERLGNLQSKISRVNKSHETRRRLEKETVPSIRSSVGSCSRCKLPCSWRR